MDSYKKLIVWQESRKLNKEIYRIVSTFPPSEIYALSDQLKRASVSITSNIAEGYGQGSLKNRLRFLFMARGSQCEVETQLIVACDLGFVTVADIKDAIEIETRIGKLLNGLIRYTTDKIHCGNSVKLGESASSYGNPYVDEVVEQDDTQIGD